jgi:hypothetical protein
MPTTGGPRAAAAPGAVLALQRSAGNRATTQLIQRAIVAIDGDKDPDASKRATVACLYNLRYKKSGKDFIDGGARGKVAGPATRGALPADLGPLLASDSESIYVLAHGSRYSSSVGDMDPGAMATFLRQRFGSRPFTGKIKLVSCHSGADLGNALAGDAAKRVYQFPKSYAEQLAIALTPKDANDTFRPSTVQGVVGIGWVDELTGSITAINKEKYDAASKKFAQNSDVGALASGKSPNPFTEMPDAGPRGAALRAEFGDPVHVEVGHAGYRDDTADPAALHFGKGKWGKRTFAVGSGAEL